MVSESHYDKLAYSANATSSEKEMKLLHGMRPSSLIQKSEKLTTLHKEHSVRVKLSCTVISYPLVPQPQGSYYVLQVYFRKKEKAMRPVDSNVNECFTDTEEMSLFSQNHLTHSSL